VDYGWLGKAALGGMGGKGLECIECIGCNWGWFRDGLGMAVGVVYT
jgi:hypothetical protein